MSENKSARLLKALVEIGQELSSTIDLEELLERLLQISREVFRFENAIIRLLDTDDNALVAAASYGYADDAVRQTIRLGQGVMGRAAATRSPVLIEDVRTLPDYVPGIPGARSELAVPLICRDKLVGVLNVESPRPGAFSPEDIEPLLTLGRQAAIAIDNARMYGRLKSLSAEHQRLHQFNDRILGSISLGVYTVDHDLHITSWNRRMAELSGVPADTAIGAILPELFPNVIADGVIERIRNVLQSGQPAKLRVTHRSLEGTIRFQKRRLAPLHSDGQVVGVVVIVEDITDFKRLLDQTIQSEKLAELGRLSAGIAHEINNPLSVIAYAMELLRREGELLPFQLEMAEKIELEVERLKTLTGGLLTFASAREGHFRLVSMNDLVDEVVRLVRFELQRQSITLVTSFSELPLISADPGKLKQVVINLVMNAAQAMQGEGKVSVSTRCSGKRTIELVVSDNGPGIPEEFRECIFNPFFTTKPEGEGTGLGLYICRNIVKEHGGDITVECPSAGGTMFRIRLPVS
jgi:PAS domain S-box-containing protein